MGRLSQPAGWGRGGRHLRLCYPVKLAWSGLLCCALWRGGVGSDAANRAGWRYQPGMAKSDGLGADTVQHLSRNRFHSWQPAGQLRPCLSLAVYQPSFFIGRLFNRRQEAGLP